MSGVIPLARGGKIEWGNAADGGGGGGKQAGIFMFMIYADTLQH